MRALLHVEDENDTALVFRAAIAQRPLLPVMGRRQGRLTPFPERRFPPLRLFTQES